MVCILVPTKTTNLEAITILCVMSCSNALKILDDLLDSIMVTTDDALNCIFRHDDCYRCCSMVIPLPGRYGKPTSPKLCLELVNKVCACSCILISTCCCRSDTRDINK